MAGRSSKGKVRGMLSDKVILLMKTTVSEAGGFAGCKQSLSAEASARNWLSLSHV